MKGFAMLRIGEVGWVEKPRPVCGPMDAVCRSDEPTPDWFRRGTEAALLAPTAMNQQKSPGV